MNSNTFNIGDHVKFLNAVGEGVVTQILAANKLMVMVDGFNIPCLLTDLVPKGGIPASMAAESDTANAVQSTTDEDGSDYVVSVAFLPPTCGKTALHILNDSCYQLYYVLGLCGDDGIVAPLGRGHLAADSKVFVCHLPLESLQRSTTLRLDAVLFKNIPYYPAKSCTAQYTIVPNLLQSAIVFTDSDFFDEPALICDLLSFSVEQTTETIAEPTTEPAEPIFAVPKIELKIVDKIVLPTSSRKKKEESLTPKNQPIVADLRAVVLRSQAGFLSAEELLTMQTQRAMQALQSVASGEVPQCVLIYGIGAVPLLNHLTNTIRTEFAELTITDASERQYFYGAISVTKKPATPTANS